MLRLGQNGEGDTQDFAIVLAACPWVLDSIEWIDGVDSIDCVDVIHCGRF